MSRHLAFFDRLPNEIIALMILYLDRDDLKAARRVNRVFSEIATRALFAEIHISPNSLSCERAHAVAKSEALRQHVRSIVYHTGQLSDDFEGFDDFRKQISIVPSRLPVESNLLSEMLLPLYAGWLEEIDAQRSFNLGNEKVLIAALCRRFPQVDSVSAIMDECDPFDLPNDYIGKRTGMPLAEHTPGMHLTALMEGVQSSSLSHICGRAISWHELNNIAYGRFDFDVVKRLELGLWNAEFIESDSADRAIFVKSFSELLSRMNALEELVLDLDELPYSAGDIKLNDVSNIMYQKRWTHLQKLELRGLTVTEHELGGFLGAHSGTLKHLHLGDIEFELQEHSDIELLGPFWLFKRLRHTMHLQRCELSGNFVQQPVAAWFVNSAARSPDAFVTRLEQYICREDIGPPAFMIEILQQRHRGHVYEEKTPIHERKPCEEQWDSLSRSDDFIVFCDESWQWCPEFVEPETINSTTD